MEKAEREAALDRNFKKLIRIVGKNAGGQYSSIWSFKGGNDGFYFSSRSAFKHLKVSLHAINNTGYFAFTREYFLSKQAEGKTVSQSKSIHEWHLPLPSQLGAVQVASIKLPSKYMVSEPHAYAAQGKVLIFEIELESAMEIGIFLSNEGRTTLEEKFYHIGSVPLFEVSIDGWFNVNIVVRSVDFDPAVLPLTQQLNSAEVTQLVQLEPGKSMHGLNAMFWNAPAAQETLQIVDVGATWAGALVACSVR